MKTLTMIAAMCLMMGAQLAFAQATAEIHGTVQDSTGAAVPGATVKATQTDTGIPRTVTTEADGSYILPNLAVGPYTIEVTKEGFSRYSQAGIVLQVNGNPAVPITLQVGSATQTVTVEANVTQVDTRSEGVGNVIENERVVDLPLNGRLPTDLIALSGAAVAVGSSPSWGMNTGITISVAGGNSTGVQYYLDGASHINVFDGTGLILPFPDALQEFKLSTSAQDASNVGRASATVNAVMKSGTNAFHGDAFEFIRNYDLNARDFFASGKDGLKRNQFGGTVGGPIRKDKVFFFAGYQGTFTRQTPIASNTFVPTAQEEQGNFQTFASPQCQNGKQVNLTGPFVNNVVPVSLLNPAALAIAAKLPTSSSPCGTYLTGTPLHENEHQIDSRVDYQLNEKHTLFARYLYDSQRIADPYTLDPSNILTASGIGANDHFNSEVVGDTWLISPTKVNSFRLWANRVTAIFPAPDMFNQQSVGINAYTYDPTYLTVAVTGGFSLGSGWTTEGSFAYTSTFGLNEDYSVVHGSHQFGFGGSAMRSIDYSVAQAFSGGQYGMTGTATGLGMADFFLGDVGTLRQGGPNPINVRQNFFGIYALDTWKATKKLTVSYGLNWDPFFGMGIAQGEGYSFSLANFYADTTSKVVANAPPGFIFQGDNGFSGQSPIKPKPWQFDPRVGLAWDPFGDGRTAVRMGAGIAHDFINQDVELSTGDSLPFALTTNVSNVNLSNPYPGGDPFPYTYNSKNPVWPTPSIAPCLASTCPPAFVSTPTNLHTTEQYSWNLALQRQVTQSLFVSATYLGNHIIHLWGADDLNPAEYIPGNCAAGQYGLTAPGPCSNSNTVNITDRRVLNLARPNEAPLGVMTFYDDGGTQSYNGLLLTTTYRLASGLNINGNFTWSHCIGEQNINGGVLNPGADLPFEGYGQNVYPANRKFDTGNCSFNRKMVANVTIVYNTPKFSNRITNMLAGGWTLASTVVARTGAWINMNIPTNPDPSTGYGYVGAGPGRPNQVLSNPYSTTQGAPCGVGSYCVSWLNPAAFTVPTIGTYGNVGTYALSGPAFWQWDQAVSRNFKIHEGQSMQARWEIFNVTNSVRLGTPAAEAGVSSLGAITSDAIAAGPTTAPYRVMQGALKFIF